MTPPQIAAGRYLWGVGLGLMLGLLYGFLRPLGRRVRTLADLLFLIGVFPAWVYFSFAVCQGDLHLGYLSSLFVGGILFDCTLGRLLRPLWRGFWSVVEGFFRKLGNIFKKIFRFLKKNICIWKKNE